MGGFTAIIAGSRIKAVTKIVSLCPPPDRIGSEKKWQGKDFSVSKRDLPNDPQQFREFVVPYSYAKDGLQYPSAVEEAKLINKPLMIFIGMDDEVVTPDRTERIVASANNPHVVRQENMGHDFRRSLKECQIVMSHIEDFLT